MRTYWAVESNTCAQRTLLDLNVILVRSGASAGPDVLPEDEQAVVAIRDGQGRLHSPGRGGGDGLMALEPHSRRPSALKRWQKILASDRRNAARRKQAKAPPSELASRALPL